MKKFIKNVSKYYDRSKEKLENDGMSIVVRISPKENKDILDKIFNQLVDAYGSFKEYDDDDFEDDEFVCEWITQMVIRKKSK